MRKFLQQPFPFFLNDHSKNTILILVISIFISLILIIYVPFENPNKNHTENIGWGLLSFSVLYAHIIILPKKFPSVFDLTEWSLLKYLAFNTWLFLFMGALFSILNARIFCGNLPFQEVFIKTQREVVLTGLIPLFMVTTLAKNNLLKQNLKDAFQTNKKLVEIQRLKEAPEKPDHPIILYTDTNETFSFNLTDFLYAVAENNYSEIYWMEEGKPFKKLLRVTLKNVELQLSNQFVVRPHRSYLINVQAIESISGNTNGYKIKLKNVNIEIPVSRAKGKEIITHIQQIRDLLEPKRKWVRCTIMALAVSHEILPRR